MRRIGGNTAVDNAIAFARFKSGAFGWGAVVPGQNLTVANQSRSADAAEMFITSGIAAVMNQYNGGDPATTE